LTSADLPLRRTLPFIARAGPLERTFVGALGRRRAVDFPPTRRVGARLGPAALTACSRSCCARSIRPTSTSIASKLQVALGDVDVVARPDRRRIRKIDACSTRYTRAGRLSVTNGRRRRGTLPQIRAAHRKFPDLVALHLDSPTRTAIFP